MGPWSRLFITVAVLRGTRRSLRLVVSLRRESPGYPQPRQAARARDPDEVLYEALVSEAWLGLAIARLSPAIERALRTATEGLTQPLVRMHVVASGSRQLVTWVRQRPWPAWLARWWSTAVVTVEGPAAGARPRLTLPLDLAAGVSAPRSETLGGSVASVQGVGWRHAIGAADIVELEPGRALPSWARSTRLTIRTGQVLPVTPRDRGSTLTIGSRERAPAFLREFYRAVMHDAPLDAAVAQAALHAELPTAAVRLDLRRGGEDDIRIGRAVVEQERHDRPRSRGTARALPSDVVDRQRRSHDFLKSSLGDLDLIDFRHEISAANRTFELFQAREAVRSRDYVRHANLWWDDQPRPPLGRTVKRPSLRVGVPHRLAFAVLELARSAATATVPDEVLARLLGEDWHTTPATLVLLTPAAAATVAKRQFDFELPRYGDGPIVSTIVTPLRTGRLSIRAALFVRGHLIASVALHSAVSGDTPRPRAGSNRQVCDWNVALDPSMLQFPAPARTLIVNQSAAHTHWLAAYARPDGPMPTAAAWPVELSPATVQDTIDVARNRLGFVQGSRSANGTPLPNANYRFPGPLTPANQGQRATGLSDLAYAGRYLYATLIENALGATGPRSADDVLAEFHATVAGDDRLLQIARCHAGAPTVPWAMVYDLPLPAAPSAPVCPHFLAELAPTPGRTSIAHRPGECAARPNCPALTAPGTVVCPFGFWGLRLELEEPCYQVTADQPPVLGVARIAATTLPAAVAVAPHDFACLDDHVAALRKVATIAPGTVDTDLTKILHALETGDEPLIYFFCHGNPSPLGFVLRVGPTTFEANLRSMDLKVEWKWRDRNRTPLVILNGCNTTAFDAKNASQFIDRFRRLGAVGVLGTAIEVFTDVATEFATEMIRRLAGGERVGAAMLSTRRYLLEQLNPMGLAYTAYAPAYAHVHVATCPLDPEPTP